MRKPIRDFFVRLPIRWKMIFWSSTFIFFLFAFYTLAQYMVLKNWMLKHETDLIQKSMGQLQDYFLEKGEVLNEREILKSRSFVKQVNQKDQFIRILNEEGAPILTVTDQVPTEWVVPKKVSRREMTDQRDANEHLIILRSPLITDHFQGTIEIIGYLETFDEVNEELIIVMFVGCVLSILFSALGGTFIAGRFLAPVRALSVAIQNVKQKGLHERVHHIENGDELAHLAALFNDMMNQLERVFLQQKQFLEDASHELRTPVTILEGHLSMLNRWGKANPDVLEESLQASLQEVKRLRGMVQELTMLIRAETPDIQEKRELIHVEEVAEQTVKSFASAHPQFQFQLDLERLSGIRIEMVGLHLEQILLIVLDNAIKYTGEHRSVEVKGAVLDGWAEVTIADRGIGIPEDELPYVFDRFYRVDKARSRKRGGSGLGLSIAKRLTEMYRGHIRIASNENEGTTVTIRFPLD
ncbi:Adaptive-response sensory-kinase SasA [Paenibacillus allorhizosphaerae]|uniref:Signal transduction histidine-protein kinase ArlS n=2 Tax=Paenibacillus allorhizosphaerae TaxID=2849866 RepID=A0ABM8VCN4_9BACL|nr:Adaptive-response sensory-kinase SasA [Paenibacillus allorhizosphaerae]